MCAKVISNKKQLERLVRLMEQNPNIANGLITKTHAKHEWERIADELNSLGPPKREWQRWLRVWTDMKYKIKSKKLHNLTELNTTGGNSSKLYQLTDLEESVLNLINLKARLFPSKVKAKPKEFVIKKVYDDDAQTTNSEKSVKLQNEKSTFDKNKPIEIYPMIESKAEIKKEIKETKTNQRLPLTNKKDAHYVHMKKEIKEVKKCFRKIKKYEKMEFRLKKREFSELIAVKKEKLQLFKEDLKHKQQIREHKLEVKLQLLEIEKQKLMNIKTD